MFENDEEQHIARAARRQFRGLEAMAAQASKRKQPRNGTAPNNAMKAQVLATVQTSELPGNTIAVVGVFTLIKPKNRLVTPVRREV